MYTSEQLRETGIIEGEIMTLCPGQHVYRNIDQIVMIQRVDEKQKREVYLNKMEEMCAALQNAIRYRHKTEKIQVGIGKMVKGIYNLKDSYYEAKERSPIGILRKLFLEMKIRQLHCTQILDF